MNGQHHRLRDGRRVRHEVRDGVAVMVFSAATSAAIAGALLLLVRLGQGA